MSLFKIFRKKGLLLVLLVFVYGSLFAQKREVGLSLGAMYYTGDMARTWVLPNTGIGGMVLLRNNINDHISLRLSYTGGNVKGSDAKPLDAFATARASSFSIFVSEFAGSFEYYFIDYRSKRAVTKFSPYFHGGLGIFGMLGQKNKAATYSSIQLALPIGFGLKYQPDKRWNIGLEFGARVLFFDYLDNVSEGDVFQKNYQYGNKYDNDNYYYVGITISKVIYKVYCPTLPLKQGYR